MRPRFYDACHTFVAAAYMGMMMPTTRWIDLVLPVGRAESIDWDKAYVEEMPRVYSFFRYRVGPGAVAEDLTSTTFMKAWRGRDRYRAGRATLSTWLFAIARNVAIDHFRRSRNEVPLDVAEAHMAPATSEDAVIRRIDAERLAALLERLPARERELIALKYGAGATNREIAKITGLSASNVGTILYRTIQSLKTEWAEGGSSHD